MPGAWDYQIEKQKLFYEVADGARFTPFVSSWRKHLLHPLHQMAFHHDKKSVYPHDTQLQP